MFSRNDLTFLLFLNNLIVIYLHGGDGMAGSGGNGSQVFEINGPLNDGRYPKAKG